MFGNKTGDEGKGKALSPLAALIDALERMGPGQQLLYTLAQMYGPEIIVVEVKKDYAGKGPKYSVLASPPVNGRPGPTRNTIWETGKAKAVASWLLGRDAKPLA